MPNPGTGQGFPVDLCPECGGEGDGMDDCFFCHTCRGDHIVCGGCGERLQDCDCEPHDEMGQW